MKIKHKTLHQITNFLRSHTGGFSTKLISKALRIPKDQVRHYIRVLKEAGYILQVHSDEHYRVYIAIPKFLNHNTRIKTILKRYKTITQLQNKENKPSKDIHKEIQEQTKEIRELKYVLAELKDEITKRRRTSFNQPSQGTLFNGG
jgi:predicted transcriptional regulator